MIIKGNELIKIMNLTREELTEYEHINKAGACGFFLNDACLYVFGGSWLIDRLHGELRRINEAPIDRSMKYVRLKKHLHNIEWRVLEYTDNHMEAKDKWIKHYDNPIFNLVSLTAEYYAVSEEQFDLFAAGNFDMAELKKRIGDPEFNRLIWKPGTSLPTIRKKGVVQGVYMIRNKKSGMKYIGSSADVEGRWKQHIAMLKGGKHHSYKMQMAYDAVNDIDVFEFSLIENVNNREKLCDREQYWLDYFDAYTNGYNCTRLSDGTDKHADNKSKLHDENEVEKFKVVYYSYKDCINIPAHSVKRIVHNIWPLQSVQRINAVMDWYLSHFNINNTVLYLRYVMNNTTQLFEWMMTVEDPKSGMILFRDYVKHFITQQNDLEDI